MAITAQTITTLFNDTRTLVGDAPSVSNSWTDDQIIAAVNFAVQHYCKITNVTYLESTIALNSSGIFTSPTDYIAILRVGYAGQGATYKWLLNSSSKEETMKNPDWENTTVASPSEPKRWVMFSGNQIKLTPKLSNWSSGTWYGAIGYVQEPTNFTVDQLTSAPNTVPDARIPITHHRHLKYAAAYWLLLVDGDRQDLQNSQNMMQQFLALIKED